MLESRENHVIFQYQFWIQNAAADCWKLVLELLELLWGNDVLWVVVPVVYYVIGELLLVSNFEALFLLGVASHRVLLDVLFPLLQFLQIILGD